MARGFFHELINGYEREIAIWNSGATQGWSFPDPGPATIANCDSRLEHGRLPSPTEMADHATRDLR